MNNWIFIYLAAGIISRAVFFIYKAWEEKKYNLITYKSLSFGVELFAHALDVIAWPYATVVSFYLINKRIKEAKEE